ncbi:MAG: histidine kinase N-terminal 7TM domain-containing protein [Pelolinea sp.]|nr:histidine kinase N-terminal 7TM domain-containing protein [Pelolinea sp.]
MLLFLRTINDVITAGVAIISFSLLIYVVTFNLHDCVTRSFTFLLACIVVVFGSDAFVTTTFRQDELFFILRIQYMGLIFLPTAYFLFSDALLTITGKPSKGKRRISGYISIIISSVFFILLMAGI